MYHLSWRQKSSDFSLHHSFLHQQTMLNLQCSILARMERIFCIILWNSLIISIACCLRKCWASEKKRAYVIPVTSGSFPSQLKKMLRNHKPFILKFIEWEMVLILGSQPKFDSQVPWTFPFWLVLIAVITLDIVSRLDNSLASQSLAHEQWNVLAHQAPQIQMCLYQSSQYTECQLPHGSKSSPRDLLGEGGSWGLLHMVDPISIPQPKPSFLASSETYSSSLTGIGLRGPTGDQTTNEEVNKNVLYSPLFGCLIHLTAISHWFSKGLSQTKIWSAFPPVFEMHFQLDKVPSRLYFFQFCLTLHYYLLSIIIIYYYLQPAGCH